MFVSQIFENTLRTDHETKIESLITKYRQCIAISLEASLEIIESTWKQQIKV